MYLRRGEKFEETEVTGEFVSPRLDVRFDLTGPEMAVYHPNGARFLTFDENREQATHAQQQAEQARRQAERERRQAEQAQKQAAEAAAENERLRALLRQAGIDPDAAGT
ncbi:MAG: hypothetical protein U0871_14545 [Gemmataceae bacterium]